MLQLANNISYDALLTGCPLEMYCPSKPFMHRNLRRCHHAVLHVCTIRSFKAGSCMYMHKHGTCQLNRDTHFSCCFGYRLHPHHHGSSSVQTHTATVPVLLDVNPSGGLDPLSSESCIAANMKEFFPADNSNEIILHIQVLFPWHLGAKTSLLTGFFAY